MASSLAEEASIWAAVSSQKVTLSELETTWTLDDLERLLAFLAFQADSVDENIENRKNKEKHGNK